MFPASIKSIISVQKYTHIIELYLFKKIFVFMFLLPINVIISFGIYYTMKESK